MVITFGYDTNTQEYLATLYVTGYQEVKVRINTLSQVIFLIKLMQPAFPISIAFDPMINMQVKERITLAIKQNITI